MLKNEYKNLLKDINQKTKLVEIKNILKEFESLRVTFPDACIVTRTVVQYRYNKWR